MSTRRATARPAIRAGTAPLPKGATIPRPRLLRWAARAIVLGALTLYVVSPLIARWASAQVPAPGATLRQAQSPAGLLFDDVLPHPMLAQLAQPDKHADVVKRVLAALALALVTPRVAWYAGAVGILGLYLMTAELALGVWGKRLQRRNVATTPITYLSVRNIQPSFSPGSGRMAGSSAASGDELYRAILRALPAGSPSTRFRGTAPWVAFTLTGRPNAPVELGIVLADRDERRRATTTQTIRSIIQGQSPTAQVDEVPDPLAAALTPGATIAWREFGLRLGSHYPLRSFDDIDGSDLLGPLAAALTPRGTRHVEAQIVVRPARSRALNVGWRGDALALKLKLEARADYSLADDARRIDAKLNGAPFETTIRVVAVADSPGERLTAALDVVASELRGLHQRTSHHLQELIAIGAGQVRIEDAQPALPCTGRAPRFAPPPELLLPLRPWRRPDIVTSIELAGLWHLPSAGLGNLVCWLPCKVLPAPPHAFIPPSRPDRVAVGRARRSDGTTCPVGPTLRDLRPPLHITAGMGAGKSRVLANICQQCVPHGFLLLDGKGDDQGGSLAATVRQYIPLEDERRLIIFDVLDTDWPVGLNPLAGIDLSRPGAKDQAYGQINAIFARLDPATWGKAPAMKEFVQMATLLVLEGEPIPTLAHVKQALLDDGYRATLLPHCTNPDVLHFWMVTFSQQGEQQRSSLHALLRRFSQLLTTETTRYMVSQPALLLDLLRTIEDRMIVLAPLPHVTLGDLAGAIGMLLLQQFVRSAFSRPGTDQTRHTYPLVIDELQVFIGKDGDSADIQHAITQLRGLGIAGIYAHQTLEQLGAIESEMLTNSGSRLILRTQEPDASTYARLYGASGITASDIAGQDADEHQYAFLLCDNERTGLFSMTVQPWPKPLPVQVDPDRATDWRRLIPSDSPDPAFDQELVENVYFPVAFPARLVKELADFDDELWQFTRERWAAIRAFHRQYILDHPGCIAVDETIVDADPDVQAAKRAMRQRLDRQRWLSRLLVATPRVLAAAEYARIRRVISDE